MRRRNKDDSAASAATEKQGAFKSSNVQVRTTWEPLRWGRKIGLSLTGFLVALAAGVGFILYSRLGFGRVDERDVEFAAQKPLLPESALEVVAELPIPPGNLATSPSGQVFFCFHPTYNSINPTGVKIAVVVQGGFEAWPSKEFQQQVVSVLSLRIEPLKNILYLLDHCEMGFLCVPTLTGLSIDSKAVVSKHVFDGVAGRGSFLNDFQISPQGDFMYLSDTSILSKTPSLIVYDVQRDTSYRVLSEHHSMYGESLFLQMQGSSQVTMRLGPFGFTTHVDGISLSRDGETLTYSAVTSHNMYAVPTKALRDKTAAPDAHVHLVSRRKPVSDGQATDAMGNVWLTAFTENALAVLRPVTHELVKVVESTKKLRWCDGLSFGPDGLYMTESALHLFLFGRGAFLEENRPFHIYKLSHAALQSAFSEDYTLPPSGQ